MKGICSAECFDKVCDGCGQDIKPEVVGGFIIGWCACKIQPKYYWDYESGWREGDVNVGRKKE